MTPEKALVLEGPSAKEDFEDFNSNSPEGPQEKERGPSKILTQNSVACALAGLFRESLKVEQPTDQEALEGYRETLRCLALGFFVKLGVGENSNAEVSFYEGASCLTWSEEEGAGKVLAHLLAVGTLEGNPGFRNGKKLAVLHAAVALGVMDKVKKLLEEYGIPIPPSSP